MYGKPQMMVIHDDILDDHWAPDKPLPFSRHLAASRGRCVRGAMEPGILTFNQVIDTLKKSLIFWH